MTNIIRTHARQILDSRGNPTVEVDVLLKCGNKGRASVPSGASVGKFEAVEIRDNNQSRYFGKGVLKSVNNINNIINKSIIGMNAFDQSAIDQMLIDLDGTPNKAKLGANSILAVSIAVAKAAANANNQPLYKYLNKVDHYLMPVPLMNIINGGVHANNNLDFQEFMIVPISANCVTEAIRMGAEIFQSLKVLLQNDNYSTNTGDEGGFAPNFVNLEMAMNYIIKAIEKAGYKPGIDIYLALDIAAGEFYYDNFYNLRGLNQRLNSQELIDLYKTLINNYPIFSIEDAMAEDDKVGWKLISKQLGNKVQLVGDDLFVTNNELLNQGIDANLANAILIKPNQIGTLSETFTTINTAKTANYNTIISHRSGETEDTTISSIAVAFSSGQIKAGSLSRTDRLAKYNELIRIEEELTTNSTYAGKNILNKFNINNYD